MSIVEQGVAAAGGLASNLLVRLPLSWRLAILRAGNVTMTQFMRTRAFRRFYLAQNKAHRQKVAEASIDQDLTTVPEGKGQRVSLFFSGGADSTYSAVLLAQQYDEVHLLSFTHDGISNIHKPKINADRLRERFGDRIVFHVVDSNEVWHRLYTAGFAEDRKRYCAFLNTAVCECCYLSWNAVAAVYNKRNGISNLAVGIGREHSGFMYSATDEGIGVMRQFHAGYGVRFFMPVYNEPETDVRLYEMGITSEKHTKRPYQFYTTATTQGTCEFGLGHRLFAQYTVVRHSPHERQERARSYFGAKLEICRDYVTEALDQNLPLPFVS